MIGENTHPMPITIMMQEIGLVKKVAALPVYWNAFNMLLSRVGPRMKARISGAVGMPAYAMKIPTTANASIMPHLYPGAGINIRTYHGDDQQCRIHVVIRDL